MFLIRNSFYEFCILSDNINLQWRYSKAHKYSHNNGALTIGDEKLLDLGKKSTGHLMPPIGAFYPYPRPIPINLITDAGNASIEEMISETKHGIFVTRFHYTNPVDHTKAVLTDLTRDGTFLIEKGEITRPVMNLRYTDSMLSALKDIKMVGKKREIIDDTTVPALNLRKLRFTGVTEY